MAAHGAAFFYGLPLAEVHPVIFFCSCSGLFLLYSCTWEKFDAD
ncbi:conserved hypothetical protein [Escherichia albertii TW07627]|uniref:Uncharacterized protein n=1 Tax=Escherichia albertii (strain TW07627) TaxID=502347 RepID=A0ABC9NNC2_ESCAT|nr:conserved hypothetical protein [Escherichia albertii TW07627]